LEAFKRIYILLSRKKIKIFNIIYGVLIYVLGVPLKFLKLCYFLILSKRSFRKTIEVFYYQLYLKLKDCKIEILNRKIYLNCFTLGKFYGNLAKTNISKDLTLKLSLEIQKVSNDFNRMDSLKAVLIEVKVGQAYDKQGNVL
jgi:hypothetical protein